MRILGMSSSSQPLSLGVPQGSVLGPLIFTLYSTLIASIARRHGLGVQLYADDTVPHTSFPPLSRPSLLLKSSVVWQRSRPGCWHIGVMTVIIEIRPPHSVSVLSDIGIMVGEERNTVRGDQCFGCGS